MADLTPRQIVAELDRYIVGQDDAKRAVAVAIRNRWRRQQLPAELRKDVTPKNIIMIGPTGVGKTEIARRLAELVGAPFLKVEATKYTEVGYHGRDVESMIRDLIEIAIGMVKQEQRKPGRDAGRGARRRTAARPARCPARATGTPEDDEENERRQRTREKLKAKLEAGELEDRQVELNVEQKAVPVQIFSNLGMEQMDVDFQNMFEKIMPKQAAAAAGADPRGPQGPAGAGGRGADRPGRSSPRRRSSWSRTRASSSSTRSTRCAARSRRTARTCRARACSATCCRSSRARRSTRATARCGPTTSCSSRPGRSTSPSRRDLMPELQGRFPIRVELTDLTRDDFLRILTEPQHALTQAVRRAAGDGGRDAGVHAGRHRGDGRHRLRGEPHDAEHRRPPAAHDPGAGGRGDQLRGAGPAGQARRASTRRTSAAGWTRSCRRKT